MNSKRYLLSGLFVVFELLFLLECKNVQKDNIRELNIEPVIEPDYSGVTIPQNIAPLNFTCQEEGISYKAVVSVVGGDKITLTSSDGIFRFPIKSWKKLLNSIQEITIELLVEGKNQIWSKYRPIHLYVKSDRIDPYLCYRLLYPGYETWSDIDILQRCTEDFEESSLVENQSIDNNCVNCHSFNRNNPDKFLLHIRGSMGGTYFVDGDTITKTDLKVAEIPNGAVYPAWHPDGKIVAFSSNKVVQSFQAGKGENIEVIDLESSLILYGTEKNEILQVQPDDTIKYMETFPEWSPDGKYLYYCRANQFIEGSDFKKIKYNIVRKPFDKASMSFGKTEIVFNALSIDKSASFPRISPDGRFLVFTLHCYGTFPIWHKDADLYLIDLKTKKLSRMTLNSEETESYHSWSANSKWLVFSSKRGDGLTARPYFAYIGSGDQVGKPFILPQKDPGLYKSMLKTFNRPEFVKGKINLGPSDFARAARGKAIKAKLSGS